MSAPTPRDTRLFDAGATWAIEPTDQRGYGDALRDAVERAGAGVTAAEGEAEREGRHLQVLVQRWHAGDIVALELAQGVGAVAHRLADEPPAPAGLQAEGAGETEVRRVLADRGYRGDDEPVHVLLGRVLDWLGARSTDPYGTGGSYRDPSAEDGGDTADGER